jgi:hypothetical protein
MVPWLCSAAPSSPAPSYHVAARYEIGGTEAGYDYLRVDSGSLRLFVAHGTRVEVIDADGGTRLGAVTNLAGVHGIEIVDRLHMAFATNGTDRTVTMFNPQTLQIVKTIKYLGAKPDGNRLVAVLDSETGKMLGTVPIGPDPDGAAFDRSSGRIFTSNHDGTLSVVGEGSRGDYELQQTVQTAPGARTIALDDKTGRLFLPAGRFGAAPVPTAAKLEPRAPLIPESFAIIVVAP